MSLAPTLGGDGRAFGKALVALVFKCPFCAVFLHKYMKHFFISGVLHTVS